MAPLLLVLLLALIVFGAGFAVKILWGSRSLVLAIRLLGFAARPKRTAAAGTAGSARPAPGVEGVRSSQVREDATPRDQGARQEAIPVAAASAGDLARFRHRDCGWRRSARNGCAQPRRPNPRASLNATGSPRFHP